MEFSERDHGCSEKAMGLMNSIAFSARNARLRNENHSRRNQPGDSRSSLKAFVGGARVGGSICRRQESRVVVDRRAGRTSTGMSTSRREDFSRFRMHKASHPTSTSGKVSATNTDPMTTCVLITPRLTTFISNSSETFPGEPPGRDFASFESQGLSGDRPSAEAGNPWLAFN
jgi:hypothetical protein